MSDSTSTPTTRVLPPAWYVVQTEPQGRWIPYRPLSTGSTVGQVGPAREAADSEPTSTTTNTKHEASSPDDGAPRSAS